ncbi:hypothetical protein BB560_002185 [Smittium megazygosporum]|uniref:peptide-methionine (S)-S-oxide reductase n=1 Tax=Smittium megazygosporum TaxID=133381 RepID=A0A2T9ZFF8_9FUNG|nr:hypothetical protein BB560_002185 [Smittium megazygosporum]
MGSKDRSFPPVLAKTQPSSEFATFAAGCFWSVELLYQRIEGVLQTQVGYTGGNLDNPSYEQVCSGSTNHAEAVLLEYDPSVVSYAKLLDLFFKKHDPTTLNRQGGDVGTQYRSAIFYHSDTQLDEAQKAISSLDLSNYRNKHVETQLASANNFKFFPAEEYHQKYLEKGGQCASKGCGDFIRCYG